MHLESAVVQLCNVAYVEFREYIVNLFISQELHGHLLLSHPKDSDRNFLGLCF